MKLRPIILIALVIFAIKFAYSVPPLPPDTPGGLGTISTASCYDLSVNQDETDVDCGGSCGKCSLGKACLADSDCFSGNCNSTLKCANPIATANCSDTLKNGQETDVDCGGQCPSCENGKTCSTNFDCESGFCNSTRKCSAILVLAGPCSNGIKDAGEADTDCGGACNNKCADSKSCLSYNDCLSGYCSPSGLCSTPSCYDAVKNGQETDIDCGGSCIKCANRPSDTCVPGSCPSGYCSLGGECIETSSFGNPQNNQGPGGNEGNLATNNSPQGSTTERYAPERHNELKLTISIIINVILLFAVAVMLIFMASKKPYEKPGEREKYKPAEQRQYQAVQQQAGSQSQPNDRDNERLKRYIIEQLRRGHGPQDIKAVLMRCNYPPYLINNAFSEIGKYGSGRAY